MLSHTRSLQRGAVGHGDIWDTLPKELTTELLQVWARYPQTNLHRSCRTEALETKVYKNIQFT